MAGYLKAHLNCSGVEANRIRRRGRLLDEHPEAADAVGEGRVSMGNVDLLAKARCDRRVGDVVGGFVPMLIERAECFSAKEFGVLVDRVVANADADGVEPDDVDCSATVIAGPDGVHLRASGGSALQAAEMKAVFDRAVEAEFRRDVDDRRAEHGDNADQHPLPRSARQRKFAAMYAIHMAAASTPPDAQVPEPLVTLLYSAGRAGRAFHAHGLVDNEDVFDAPSHGWESEDPHDLAAVRCETSTGIPVSDHDMVRAMIRGRIRRAVVDTGGVAIDLGPKRRLFTGAAAEAARMVVVECVHPGCSIPAEFAQIDHMVPYADGGTTDQRNAAPLCGLHNRFKHRAGFRSRRARDGRVYLIRPDGSVVVPVGQRPPEFEQEHDTLDVRGDRCPEHETVVETIGWDEFVDRQRRGRDPDSQQPGWTIVHLEADRIDQLMGR
ncbi:HNH endonuclease signature motif containing protein [Ilumatobacter nonamiensis]|uniref:HNH endonuclease signature motif containing protein n=1 Tax=Ilumatobacter nonamiensis TaxID=467093 RepID=UPI00034B1C46|nr:HNH endonuclease signature motif containing protein [Ilumatobacter nonamiensis]